MRLARQDPRTRTPHAAPQRPPCAVYQPRQCRQHASASKVVDAVQSFLPYYSSVHRGAGFKSRVSTAAYDEAHETHRRFVGADRQRNTVIFGKNTTEAINKLAYRFPVAAAQRRSLDGDGAPLERSPLACPRESFGPRVTPDGRARRRRRRPPARGLWRSRGAADSHSAHRMSPASCSRSIGWPARRTRSAPRILVDAAQLAPHRRIDVKPNDDPEHLDFVALSAHKMYAPFGTGALIGGRDMFRQGAPDIPGRRHGRDRDARRRALGRAAGPRRSRQSERRRRRCHGGRGTRADGCGHGRRHENEAR